MQERRRVDRTGIGLASITSVDLYHRNAFRLSGLPVDASPRQVRRRSTELEAADRLGSDLPRPTGPLPVEPPPSNAEILTALRRLHDPNRRIVDEFLWLWPDTAERAVELHNSAVESHVSALEDDYPDSAVDERWGVVYRRWNAVLNDEECWRRLVRRVESLADPQLRTSAVEDLRRELPDLLLGTHAALAVAEFAHDRDRGLLQADAMLESEYDDAMIDRALLEALEPQVSRLKSLIERTKDAPEDTGFQRVCRRALEESEPDLAALLTLVGAEHPVVSGIADDLASSMRERVVGAMNRVPEDEKVERRVEVGQAVQWLDRAAAIAVGPHARRQIDEDVHTLLSNVVIFACRAAEEESRRHPRSGLAAQRTLTEASHKPLARIKNRDGERYSDLCDEVAGTSFLILVEYVRATGDGAATIAELNSLMRMTSDQELRAQLYRTTTLLEYQRNLGPPSGGAPRTRSIWESTGDVCAMCDRTATGTRVVTLSRFTTPRDIQATTVEVASCERCMRKNLTPSFAGCLVLLFCAALIILGLVVLLSPLTWSSTDWWFGWMIAALALTGYLSGRGERRRQRLEQHSEIRRLLNEQWQITK